MEYESVPRLVCLQTRRYEPIEREWLVSRAEHQGLVHIPDKTLGGRQGFDIVWVQTVESPQVGEIEPSALGRFRIDMGQLNEIRRECGFSMHRDGADRLA